MKSLKLFLLASLVILFSSVLQGSDIDCEDNNRTEQGTGITIDGDCVTAPDLPYPDKPTCSEDPRLVQGAIACIEGTEVPDPGPYPPVPSIPCPAGKIVDQGTGECTLDAPDTSEPLPANLIITKSALRKVVASTYDDTYVPAIDIQGIIDENGLTVSVPYIVTTSPVRLQARRHSVTLDASVTQDSESGIIATFAWAEQTLPVGSGFFAAIITIDDSAGNDNGDYLAKKLDIGAAATGGLLAATFPYAFNNTGGTSTLSLKIFPGIPDRMFGKPDKNGDDTTHEFLYVPVTNSTTEEIWLSNNLGSNYANLNSFVFDIEQQAVASNDYKAYGSLFQWGRKADGHELINWINGGTGGGTNGTTGTRSDNPTNALFIITGSYVYDWRVNKDDTLWTLESGTNNVCPIGYRVPTTTELESERESWGSNNAAGALASSLTMPMPGRRYGGGPYAGTLTDEGQRAYYWSSTPYSGISSYSINLFFLVNDAKWSISTRTGGMTVRCIKD